MSGGTPSPTVRSPTIGCRCSAVPRWEKDDKTGQYYLHSFLVSQPDLNWRNPELERAMLDGLRFWMDRGVDGFRIDVAQKCMKDPLLRDNPPAAVIDPTSYKFNPEWAATEHIYDSADPDIHLLFRKWRSVLDEYPEKFSVGEIHEWDWEKWASYYGGGQELHMPFNFAPLTAGTDPAKLREIIVSMERALPEGAWPNWVLGNHDERRIATRLGWRESAAMAVVLLTLRGTPTIYYGEEIGMEEADIPPERQLDPYGRRVPGQGRDGCRTPMQWSGATHSGFSPASRCFNVVAGSPRLPGAQCGGRTRRPRVATRAVSATAALASLQSCATQRRRRGASVQRRSPRIPEVAPPGRGLRGRSQSLRPARAAPVSREK